MKNDWERHSMMNSGLLMQLHVWVHTCTYIYILIHHGYKQRQYYNFISQQFNSGVSKYFKLTVSKTKILHTSYITAVFISGLGIFATVSVIFWMEKLSSFACSCYCMILLKAKILDQWVVGIHSTLDRCSQLVMHRN